jgi:homocysteine S-methyltransferase
VTGPGLLGAGGVLVADGAMGTVLHAAGHPLDRALPELNLSDPALVRRIHDSYLAAGVGLVQTNTFGASRLRLEDHGLGEDTVAITTAGVRVARDAVAGCGRQVLVGGSVSPAVTVQQRRRVGAADREAALREQIHALAAAGVDVLVLETFGYLDELVEAVGVAGETGLPVIASATFAPDGRTFGGDTPHDVCSAVAGLPVVALGTNCTLGPQGVLAVVQELRAHTDLPIAAQPNAGLPRRAEGSRFSYDVDAQYVARYARLLVEAGAAVVGGCCGTTPAHLAAVVRALATAPARTGPGRAGSARTGLGRTGLGRPGVGRTAAGQASGADPLSARLHTAGGLVRPERAREASRPRFRVLAEIEPPEAGHVAEVVSRAAEACGHGVDALWVPTGDGPRARLGPVNLAVHLQHELGVDTLASVTTWDRTIMALQADLLGAHALGVRRIVCETGSPPLVGDYPNVDGVWDVDSTGLVELLTGLNEGRDRNGLRLAGKTAFEIGVRVAPGSRDREVEARRALRKVEAGAQFLVTRPVYDLESWRRLRDALGEPAPVLVSVRPLRSFAEAEFLAHEVPDTEVPTAALALLERAGNGAPEAGIDLAAELIGQVRSDAEGVVILLPEAAAAAEQLVLAAGGS